MNIRYSIILAFMGQVKDRFAIYQEPRAIALIHPKFENSIGGELYPRLDINAIALLGQPFPSLQPQFPHDKGTGYPVELALTVIT